MLVVFWGVVLVAGWKFYRQGTLDPYLQTARQLFQDPMKTELPADNTSPLDVFVRPAEKAPPPAPVAQPAIVTPSPQPAAVQWQDPGFLSGVAHYNAAIRILQSAGRERLPRQVYLQVEEHCQRAMAAFENCRASAPADVPLDQYIRQAQQLRSSAYIRSTAE